MIKVSVMYPSIANSQFDHEYYRATHMPLVQALLGDGCLFYTIDKGIAGGDPGSGPTYTAVGSIYSESVDKFQAGMKRSGAKILADFVNYTDLQPVIQISAVVVGHEPTKVPRP